MRTPRRTGLAVALSLLISVAAVGQQETVVDPFDVALADAARQNNFAEFDRLFQTNPLPAYEELHRLWSWSMNDPAGGFYGAETYGRLAAAYPGFASFIASHKIVDSKGGEFYPTVETRAFLLSQAVRGVVAESPRALKRAEVAKRAEAPVTAPATVVKAPVPLPAPETPVRKPAPQSSSEPIAAAPVDSTPVIASSVVARPAVAAPVVQATVAKPVSSDLGRGIFLIIAGLFGLGLVSVMLHTPPEEQTPAAHP